MPDSIRTWSIFQDIGSIVLATTVEVLKEQEVASRHRVPDQK